MGNIPSYRVYVLKKNGVYPWHSKLSLMSGDTLRIRAEYGGAGSIPQIWLYDEVGNTRPPEAMVVTSAASNNNVISLKNLLISGFGEYDYREVDGVNTSLLSIRGVSSIYIDSCILKSTNASHIRIDNGYVKVMKVTNSIFADMGFLGTSSLLEGKAIDFQSGGADSCIIENNTFVNWQSSIINHYPASGYPLKYLKFDHNTLVNGVSYQGLMCLGHVEGGSITITNNLLIDPFSLGNDIDAFRETCYPSGEVQENGLRRLPWIHATKVTNTTFTISNNYYTISDSGAVYYNAYASYQNEGVPLSHAINARLAASGGDTVQAFKKAAVQAEKVPYLMTKMNRWYSSGNPDFTKISDGIWAYDYDRKPASYYLNDFNCNFKSNVDLTGVGAHRWSQQPGLPDSLQTRQHLYQGWNLCALPRINQSDSIHVSIAYPGKTSTVWSYNMVTKVYESQSYAKPGMGLWVNNKLDEPSFSITGVATTLPLRIPIAQSGWAFIGGRTWPTPKASLRLLHGGHISGSMYRYNQVTKAYDPIAAIIPGEAAWVNVQGSGTYPDTLVVP